LLAIILIKEKIYKLSKYLAYVEPFHL